MTFHKHTHNNVAHILNSTRSIVSFTYTSQHNVSIFHCISYLKLIKSIIKIKLVEVEKSIIHVTEMEILYTIWNNYLFKLGFVCNILFSLFVYVFFFLKTLSYMLYEGHELLLVQTLHLQPKTRQKCWDMFMQTNYMFYGFVIHWKASGMAFPFSIHKYEH